jgi:tripartite-type tricarboxylate transporter receptor subunit TctC
MPTGVTRCAFSRKLTDMDKTIRSTFALCILASANVAAQPKAVQDYPSRPIRLIVPFSAGGGTDILARALGQHLSSAFRQSVIVDNRAGGNTLIGSEPAANAAPDGQTLLVRINNLTAMPFSLPLLTCWITVGMPALGRLSITNG